MDLNDGLLTSLVTVMQYYFSFFFTELEGKTLDLDTLKKQSEGTNKEYDRLLKEFAQVQVIIERICLSLVTMRCSQMLIRFCVKRNSDESRHSCNSL